MLIDSVGAVIGKNGNLVVGLENVDVVAGYSNASRGALDAVG